MYSRSLNQQMFRNYLLSFCAFVVLIVIAANAAQFRPPAVPLVACDPYFSVWSPADKLTGAASVHWTGKAQPLTSLVRIDRTTYRLLGVDPQNLPALGQTRLDVLPTRTIATFEGAGVRIKLTF